MEGFVYQGEGFNLSLQVDHGAVTLQLVFVKLQQVEQLLPSRHYLLLPLTDLDSGLGRGNYLLEVNYS